MLEASQWKSLVRYVRQVFILTHRFRQNLISLLVEIVREVGCAILGSLGACKGNLHGIEVTNGPHQGQVYRA